MYGTANRTAISIHMVHFRTGLRTLSVAILVLGCAKPGTQEAEAFTAWAVEELIAVNNLDARLPEGGLARIRDAIGSARVVGVGESRHDTREQLLLKALLVRHLIEDFGFRALILEESFPHAEVLDRYVVYGEGDLRELTNRLAGWYLWDTEEMLELLSWIQRFNTEHADGLPVRVLGMDVTAPALAVEMVLDILAVTGLETDLDPAALGLDLLEGDFWPVARERYGALDEERRGELRHNYAELGSILKKERSKVIAASSAEAYERALWLAEVGRAGNALFSSPGVEEGGAIRERGMADSVLWILDHEVPGERAIVWAHNLHVAKSSFRMPGFADGLLEPMGIQLSEALGDDYVAIGGTFGSGSYPAGLPPGERTFELPPANAMDGALARVGVPCFLLDLRATMSPEAASWLARERGWRAQNSSAMLVPSASFDLVYFVKDLTRSQPTPLALQRFQSLAEGR